MEDLLPSSSDDMEVGHGLLRPKAGQLQLRSRRSERVKKQTLIEGVVQPSKPVEQVVQPSKPVEQVMQPKNPFEQVVQPNKPVEKVMQSSKSVEQVVQSSKSVEQVVQSSKSVEKVVKSSKPVEQVVQSSKSVEQVVQSSKSVEKVVQSSKSVEKVVEPNKPVEQVVQPSKPIVEEEPVEHVVQAQREPSPVSQHHDNTVSTGPAASSPTSACEDVLLPDSHKTQSGLAVKKKPSKRQAVKEKQLKKSLGGILTRQKSKDAVRKTRQQAKESKGEIGGKFRKVTPCRVGAIARSKNAITKTPVKVKRTGKVATTTTGKKTFTKRAAVARKSCGGETKTAEQAELLPCPEEILKGASGEGGESRDGDDNPVEKLGKKGGHLPSAEDSGYTQSSDGSSSRNSRALDSNSPLLFPPEGEEPDLPSVFDDSGGETCCLNRDPNLHSNMNNSSILEPKCPSDVARLSTIGVESEACLPSVPMSPGHRGDLYKDGIIFPELEDVLNMQSETMFEPKDLVVYGATGGNGMEEGPFGGYSVETILDSEGISDWLREFGDSKGDSVEVNVDVNNICSSISLAVDSAPPKDRQSGGTVLTSGFQATGFEEEESPAVNVASVVTVECEEVGPVAAKKKRGRPKKDRPPSSSPPEAVVKRPRGRPRKHPLVSPDRGAGDNVAPDRGAGDESNLTPDGAGDENSIAAKRFKPDVQKVKKKRVSVRGLVWNSRSKSGRNICPSWKVVESITDKRGVSEKGQVRQKDGCGDETLQAHSVERVDPGKSVAMEDGGVETAEGEGGCGVGEERGRALVEEVVCGEGDGGGDVDGEARAEESVGTGHVEVGKGHGSMSRVKQCRRSKTVIHLKKTSTGLPVPISPKHCPEGGVGGASPRATREMEVSVQRFPSNLIVKTTSGIVHTKPPAQQPPGKDQQPAQLPPGKDQLPPGEDQQPDRQPPGKDQQPDRQPPGKDQQPDRQPPGKPPGDPPSLELAGKSPPPKQSTPDPPQQATPPEETWRSYLSPVPCSDMPPMEATPLPVGGHYLESVNDLELGKLLDSVDFDLSPEYSVATAPKTTPPPMPLPITMETVPSPIKTTPPLIETTPLPVTPEASGPVESSKVVAVSVSGKKTKKSDKKKKFICKVAKSKHSIVQDGVVKRRKLSLSRAGSQEKDGVVGRRKLSLSRAGSQEKDGVVGRRKLSLSRAGSQERGGVMRSLTPCRSPTFNAEWEDDDCIDIHPTEEDQYATDVGEEDPLSRIFPHHRPQKAGSTKQHIPAGHDHAPSAPATPQCGAQSLLGVPGSGGEPLVGIQPLMQRGLQSRHARLQAVRHAAQRRNSGGNSPMSSRSPSSSQ